MSAELAERLEILRRIGERGLKLAQNGVRQPVRGWINELERGQDIAHEQHLDLWQHLLDELKRVASSDTRSTQE